MAFFNYVGMQVSAKIVYYGPGLCGKTTNLQNIYQKTALKSRGEMVSLETEADRTLFFDLLPIEVGMIGGFKVKFQLYTVPGQVFYNETRKMVLKGVDGIVFVADSQPLMLDSNLEALHNLHENLAVIGVKEEGLPLVFQYNKRDLDNALPITELNAALNPDGKHQTFEASARTGAGVFETLRGISALTLGTLRERLAAEADKSSRAASLTRLPAIPAVPPARLDTGLPPAPSARSKRTSRDLEELLAMVAGKKKSPDGGMPKFAPAALPPYRTDLDALANETRVSRPAPDSSPAPTPPASISRPPAPLPAPLPENSAGPVTLLSPAEVAPQDLQIALKKILPGKIQKVRISIVADDGERVERFDNVLTIEMDGSKPVQVKIGFTRE